MKIWSFKVFVSDSGSREIDGWLDAQPKGAKAKINKIITYLEISDISKWVRPYVAKLKGSDNIWEIRAVFGNVQYRPLGCFGPQKDQFTLLVGAIEKGGRLEPINVIEVAEQRRNLIFQDERYADEY
jgi:hypothetical protein